MFMEALSYLESKKKKKKVKVMQNAPHLLSTKEAYPQRATFYDT